MVEKERDEREINPLVNVVVGKKSSSNITDITDITDARSRRSISIYISPNILNGFNQYANMTGRSIAEIHEAALLEYMRNHPSPQLKIDLIQDLKAALPDIQTRLRNKVLRDRITNTMKTLRRLEEKGTGDINHFKAQLQKLVLQAARLKYLDADMLKVLEEAEELV